MEQKDFSTAKLSRRSSVKRNRSGSIYEDFMNTGPNFINSEAMAADSIQNELQDEIDELKMDMAYQSINGIFTLSKLGSKKIDSEMIIDMINSLKEKKKQLEKYTNTSKYVRSSDKVFYMIGSVLTFMTWFFIGKYPTTYYFYWLVFLEVSLILKRFILYRGLKWHYFLLDF